LEALAGSWVMSACRDNVLPIMNLACAATSPPGASQRWLQHAVVQSLAASVA
jgi:hypothetical protein